MAPKKKLTKQEAKAMLQRDGLNFSSDFHTLSSYDVGRLADAAKMVGYRKSKNAPGSTARMFFQLLQRTQAAGARPVSETPVLPDRRAGFRAPEVYWAGTSFAPSQRPQTPEQRRRIAAEVDSLVDTYKRK